MGPRAIPSSFRDPDGFLFLREGVLYRQVNRRAQERYDRLLGSGLYRRLVDGGLLIAHEEVACAPADPETAYRILKPEPVPFISYPYEWCFSQLRDAALLTLQAQRIALDHDMSLKDSSAFNVQFLRGRPIFIDTLSFEQHTPGTPWVAYRQFCEHFLAPLALMAHCDARLSRLLAVHLDGVPLTLASRLLPFGTRLSRRLLMHIHWHAGFQQRYADAAMEPRGRAAISRRSLLAVIADLGEAIRGLRWRPGTTPWGDYYTKPPYSAEAFQAKARRVSAFLADLRPRTVWDLGANTGVFSRLASAQGVPTVAFDLDPAATDACYRRCVDEGEANLLPLVLDLANPSPGLGWMGTERMSLFARGPAEAVMALALMHHLLITNNLPLLRLADFFAAVGQTLIIEFVPVCDGQVQQLLRTRQDTHADYTRDDFERAFGARFDLLRAETIDGSERILYLMRKRSGM